MRRINFIWGLLLCLCWGGVAAAVEMRYIIAVVPQFSPIQTQQAWSPLLTRLEQATGYRFQLRLYDHIPRFESEVLEGIPDLAYMNPYHMVMARQAQQYRPLVRDRSSLTGILVTRRDGGIKRLSDLQGKTVAFPSPNAFGASLYMRALLAEKEKLKIHPVYAGNHQNVYRQVLRGDAQAGGGVSATLSKEPEAVQSHLITLYTTPEVASHPLAAHPRVPDAVARKISDALLALQHDTDGMKLLELVQLGHPVLADYRRDYEPLGQLKLERYVAN